MKLGERHRPGVLVKRPSGRPNAMALANETGKVADQGSGRAVVSR